MSTPARRGEAHLWLLLEEALVAIGRGGADPWEVQRHFRYVTDAVVLAGVVRAAVARTLSHELDDALVVRRIMPAASFSGLPPEAVAIPEGDDGADGPNEDPVVWLEAELERHIDLLTAYDPTTGPDAGAETLRIVAGPVRAFEAAGVLGPSGRGMVADLTTSLAAAGFDPGRAATGDGRVRREWVRFLRDRPPPTSEPFEPAKSVRPRTALGRIGERNVRVDEVAWDAHTLELAIALRAVEGIGRPDRTPWHARVLDQRGRLHLGPSVTPIVDGASATFRLRPGLEDGVSVLHVRITSRGRRVEAPVTL